MKSFKHFVKIQINYSIILDIIKQNFIVLTLSIMRMNIKFIRVFQFLR